MKTTVLALTAFLSLVAPISHAATVTGSGAWSTSWRHCIAVETEKFLKSSDVNGRGVVTGVDVDHSSRETRYIFDYDWILNSGEKQWTAKRGTIYAKVIDSIEIDPTTLKGSVTTHCWLDLKNPHSENAFESGWRTITGKRAGFHANEY